MENKIEKKHQATRLELEAVEKSPQCLFNTQIKRTLY